MFANSTTLAFFPTFVWLRDLAPADYEPLNRDIMKVIDEIREKGIVPDEPTAYQTDYTLHQRPELARLVEIVNIAAKEIFDFLKLEDAEFGMTGCWASISQPGAAHHEHSHPNNYLSGVYYVKTPAGGDTITFADPRPTAHVIAPRAKKRTMHVANEMFINAQPGRLVLFPAWLRHSVPFNKSNEERISVAFNLMFTDFYEQFAKPVWTGRVKPKE